MYLMLVKKTVAMDGLINWKATVGETLEVRVTPKSSSNRLKVEELPGGKFLVRVYITTVPEAGKANRAVIALLAKELGIAKSNFTIIRGLGGKEKIIHIDW